MDNILIQNSLLCCIPVLINKQAGELAGKGIKATDI
jgi:hypothetical protein